MVTRPQITRKSSIELLYPLSEFPFELLSLCCKFLGFAVQCALIGLAGGALVIALEGVQTLIDSFDHLSEMQDVGIDGFE